MKRQLREWLLRERDHLRQEITRPEDVDIVLQALGGLGVVGEYVDLLESAVRRSRAFMFIATNAAKDAGGPLGDLLCESWCRLHPGDDPEDAEDRDWLTRNATRASQLQAMHDQTEVLLDALYDALRFAEEAPVLDTVAAAERIGGGL